MTVQHLIDSLAMLPTEAEARLADGNEIGEPYLEDGVVLIPAAEE